MSEDLFSWCTISGYSILGYRPWWERGVVHGFVGTTGDFRNEMLSRHGGALARALGAEVVFALRQVHRSAYVEVRARSSREERSLLGEGDALIGSADDLSRRAILGIRTADCVPLLLRWGDRVAAIHAGWRGLAGGIISTVVRQLARDPATSGERAECVIGPCAGRDRYEVGDEVIEALRGHAVSIPGPGRKTHLDLGATARSELARVASDLGVPSPTVVLAPICTIESSLFYSYRRSGAGCGSNLAFIGGAGMMRGAAGRGAL